MTPQSAHAMWATALGNLQLEVTRHNFETWLKHTAGLTLEDGRLTVGVPSLFVAENLEKRMTPLIVKTVKGIAQREIEVVFQVHQARIGLHVNEFHVGAGMNDHVGRG